MLKVCRQAEHNNLLRLALQTTASTWLSRWCALPAEPLLLVKAPHAWTPLPALGQVLVSTGGKYTVFANTARTQQA